MVVSRFLNLFLYLESILGLDVDNELYPMALHLVYISLLTEALPEFVNYLNNHPLSTESNYSLHQMWALGMLSERNIKSCVVQDILHETEIDEGDGRTLVSDGE